MKESALFLSIPAYALDRLPRTHAQVFGLVRGLSGSGSCWASNEYLSKKLRLGERRIQTVLSDLVSWGWLQRTIVRAEDGTRRELVPLFHSSDDLPEDQIGGSQEPPKEGGGGDLEIRGGRSGDHPGGDLEITPPSSTPRRGVSEEEVKKIKRGRRTAPLGGFLSGPSGRTRRRRRPVEMDPAFGRAMDRLVAKMVEVNPTLERTPRTAWGRALWAHVRKDWNKGGGWQNDISDVLETLERCYGLQYVPAVHRPKQLVEKWSQIWAWAHDLIEGKREMPKGAAQW